MSSLFGFDHISVKELPARDFLSVTLLALFWIILMTGDIHAKIFSELLWQKRLLVVFDQSDPDRSLAQRRMLDGSENEARDLVVIEVPMSGAVVIPGIGTQDAQDIRRSYGIMDSAPFTVLLIGKDGGVKLRSEEPISAHDLSSTIDAMPMRRREASGG